MADDKPEEPADDKAQPEESGAASKKKAKKTVRKTPAKKTAAEKTPAPEAAAKPAADEPAADKEVPAEPFDASRDAGPTVDMPPPGSRATAAVSGSAALAATCHLLGLADFTVSELLIGLLAPLILWLVFKDTDAEVDYHGKESINFQLNVLAWSLISWLLAICLIGIPMRLALSVLEVVLIVLASIAAAKGERYRYPFIYRILQ
jgi:hypothetical protein